MKIAAGIGGSGLAIGALYAGGVLSGGEVYNLPVDQVRAELATMPIPAEVRIAVGGSDRADISVTESSGNVTWRFATVDGDEARFSAKLEPLGPGQTRVSLSYGRGKPSSLSGRMAATGFMRSFAENSFAEQLDAELEGRAADQSRAAQAFAEEMARDPEKLRELGLTVEQMFVEVSNQASGFAHESAGPSRSQIRERMEAATQPMVVLPSNR